jgi:transporter family-2 protein
VPRSLLLVTMVVVGALLGLQARINGELGAHLHSAIAAALVSFAGGTVLLALLLGTRRAGLRRLRAASTKWWWWLGGLGGAAVVGGTAQGVPQIGVALVSVCIVAGMAAGALGVDAAGLGPGTREAVSGWRLAGAVLAVVAVLLGALGDRHGAVRPALFALLFGAGVAAAVQQAANGRIRVAAGDAIVAAFVSFLGGTVVLAIAAVAAGQLDDGSWPSSWWLYLGGPAGVIYITLAAAAVHEFGVLRLSLATVAGQLIGAVLLDVTWPAPGTSLRAATVVGTALTMVAVAISAVDRRRATAGG